MKMLVETFIGSGGTLEQAMNMAVVNMRAYIQNNMVAYVSHTHSHSHTKLSEHSSTFNVSIILVCRS